MSRDSEHRPSLRRGASSLELQVAFVVFSLALVGIAPMANHATTWSAQLDSQVKPYDTKDTSGTTFYLQSTATPWAAKLGVAASATTATPPPPRTLIDNGGPQYAESTDGNAWVSVTGQGYGGDCHRYEASATQSNANWEFTGLSPGRYIVYMTWPNASDLAPDAKVTVYDKDDDVDKTVLTTWTITPLDQRQVPSGKTYQSTTWKALIPQDSSDSVIISKKGNISVQMDTSTDHPVVADAVTVIPAPRSVNVASYEIDAQQNVTLQVSVQ